MGFGFRRLPPALAVLVCGGWLVSSRADTLQPLGDEFGDAASKSVWRLLNETEGWQANQLELWDVNTSRPGFMRMMPFTSSWFGELRGVLVYKDIAGDFIATTRLRVRSRHNAAAPTEVPNKFYTLAGIFARAPRAVSHGAPDPYTTAEIWPPTANGSDWTTGGENYIFLSFGTAGNPGTRQYEIKSTRDSVSHLYFSSQSVPQGTAEGNTEVWLQMIRVGNTVVCLRKHGVAGAWIVENRYPNPDHPFPAWGPSVQIGITTYTDWDSIGEAYWLGGDLATSQRRSFRHNYTQLVTGTNAYGGAPHQPDLVCDVDHVHFRRPDPVVTEAALEAMTITYQPVGSPQTFRSNPPGVVATLSTNGTGAVLGDAADGALGSVAFSAPSFSGGESQGALFLIVRRTGPNADRPLSLHYDTAGGTAIPGADFVATSGTLAWAANDPAEKAIAVPLVNDGLAEGPQDFFMVLSGIDGPATFPASAPALTAALTLDDHPFDQWRFDHFGAAADTGVAAGDADFEGDGLTNLVEYALGGDPSSPSSAALPLAASDGAHAGISFTPAAAPGVRLVVEVSDQLADWVALASRKPAETAWTPDTLGTVVALDGSGRVRVLEPSVGTRRRFFRLRVMVE